MAHCYCEMPTTLLFRLKVNVAGNLHSILFEMYCGRYADRIYDIYGLRRYTIPAPKALSMNLQWISRSASERRGYRTY